MSKLRDRINRAAAAYVDKRCPVEDSDAAGRPVAGWGLRPGALSTISNTAEVLAVLRAGGQGPGDPAVDGGIEFLRYRFQRFTLTKADAPATGELGLEETRCLPYTRYFVWGLMGLTEFPLRALSDEALEVAEGCYAWLIENQRADGGWLRYPATDEPSLLQTSTAVVALARYERRQGRSPASSPAIVAGVEALRRHRGEVAWPLSLLEGQRHESPAQTALCVIALNALASAYDDLDGDDAERRASELRTEIGESVAWLLDEAASWARAKEVVDEARGTPQARFGATWRHMSWALGLIATLDAGVSISEPRLRGALDFLEGLWVETVNEWRDGDLEADPSVRATYAAVMASEAIARALEREDPLEIAQALHPVAPNAELVLHVLERPSIALEWDGGVRLAIRLTPTRWELLRHLAARDGDGRPVPLETVIEGTRWTEHSARREISRINARVREETDGRVPQLVQRELGAVRLVARPAH